MKNILIPIDFSNNVKSAVDYAIKLYKTEPCTFYFLHSTYLLNPVSRTYITPHYVNKLHKQGQAKLEEFEMQAKNENINIKHNFKSIISKKKLQIAISKAFKKNNIELIIMSTKGITDASEYFVGSNTIDVVNNVNSCPILVIPNKHNFITPKQIAFPTDYNRFYDDKELKPLKNMAKLYNSEIRVLHINVEKKLTDNQKRNIKLLDEHLTDFKHNFHFFNDNSKKSEHIETFIKNFNIDMLVLVNYEHSLIEKIIKEPVIKKLVFHPKIPLLVIPE